jgi:hypothetical protein
MTPAGEGRSRPAYVNTNGSQPPVLHIAPGERQVFDLYYPLPARRDRPGDIWQYDLLWSAHTPARVFAERTPFERTDAASFASAGMPYADLGVSWGPIWWYDPLYPSVTFAHPVIIHHAHPVVVRRPFVGPRRVWIAHPTRHAL